MNDMLKYLLIALLAVSCVQREPSGVPEDGMVEVHILAPQVYGHQPGSPATKAVGDIDDRLPSLSKMTVIRTTISLSET